MPIVYRTPPKDQHGAYGGHGASGLMRCGSHEAALTAGNEGKA
jgi:hypothetical protein